jgi:hypothetical protein
MVEYGSTAKLVGQQLGEERVYKPRENCEKDRASILDRWQQILKNISGYAEANVYKYDRYAPVLLGGGSIMFIRCEPESSFREGK